MPPFPGGPDGPDAPMHPPAGPRPGGPTAPRGAAPRPGRPGGPGRRPPGRGPGGGRGGGGGGGDGPGDPFVPFDDDEGDDFDRYDAPAERGGGPRGPGGPTRTARKPRKRSIIWRWRRPLFLIALAMLAGMTGVAVVFAQTELPEFDARYQTSLVCADDVLPEGCNETTAMARLLKDEDRTNVALANIPPALINAVIAMEDRDFFEHDGVNPLGIARAAFQNIKGGGVSQGGSTITQQYVKNAFKLSTERALSRKIKEAVLSIKLEQQMSKEDILEGYLNTIYFGRGAYGVAAASQAYFGIDVTAVTESEAALLAGLIRAPASADPTKHPEEATRRRHTALVAMRDEGYITEEQFAALDPVPVAEPWIRTYSTVKEIDVRRGGGSDVDHYMGTDYLSEYIQKEVKRIDPVLFTDEMIDHGGLRIYTSINYDKQNAAWQAVTSTLPNEDDPATPDRYEGDPEAALVSVDDQGLIRAMVGSRHQFHAAAVAQTDGQPAYENNYALLGREPGSTFKPLVLAEAIREQISLKSRFDAQGLMTFPQWKTNGEPWEVGNYDETHSLGVINLMQATGQSSNTAYAQLMLALGTDPVDPDGNGVAVPEGPNNVADLAVRMGIGGDAGILEDQRVPSMVLGTVNATPVQMAGVYSTFANRGWYKRPSIITRIEQVDQEGNSTTLWAYQPQPTQVLTETQADLVTHALTFPVSQGGTAPGANLGKDTAGKTGTSQENRNAWFAGFVPRLTTVVWMGYPDAGETGWDDPDTPNFDGLLWPMNRKGRLVQGKVATGGSFPATIWKKYMDFATEDMDDSFVVPTDQQINLGTILNKNDLHTSDETTVPVEPGPDGPPTTDGNGNGNGGGPGGTRPTFTLPTTTDPNEPTTTGGPITTPTLGPPRPND
jgi:membrane peptidoglycan carboxypeptidase